MRKCAALIFAVTLLFASCGKADGGAETGDVVGTLKIVQVVSAYDASNERANAEISEAIKEFCEESGYESSEFHSASASFDGYREAMASAVESGADVIVCEGETAFQTVLALQEIFPNVVFLCAGAEEPVASLGEVMSERVHLIRFREEDAGYLAGYIAVYSGASSPGFIAIAQTDPVVNYFRGFVSGISDAALQLGKDGVTVKCSYKDGFGTVKGSDGNKIPKLEKAAKEIYNAGCDVVASCGAAVPYTCAAARELGGKVIPLVSDLDDEYGVFTAYPRFEYKSAVKNVLTRLKDAGMKWNDDDAGKVSLVGLADGAVKISGEVKGMLGLEEIEKRFSSGGAVCVANSMTEVSADGVEIEFID
ncbi:MAG: BMP family ABC transporter substrate-binding protein [Clostridia bacterium]|nr:BMP family ABC transporter substrate-binding protein [Clostridia bacterium]